MRRSVALSGPDGSAPHRPRGGRHDRRRRAVHLPPPAAPL